MTSTFEFFSGVRETVRAWEICERCEGTGYEQTVPIEVHDTPGHKIEVAGDFVGVGTCGECNGEGVLRRTRSET